MNTPPSPQTILIAVSDDRTLSTLLDVLTTEHYRMIRATDAPGVLDLVASENVQAFVLEYRTDGIDGIALCANIRSLPRHQMTPIILIADGVDPDDYRRAFEAGCDDVIGPDQVGDLLQPRVRTQIEKAQRFQRLERAHNNLKRYVSERTRDAAEASTTGRSIPPEEREVVICFTDIRGFTTLSEEMDPGSLFAMVNDHLADQVRLVHEHGGYIDKFGGDGLMAIFDGADMAARSCVCALEIIDSLTLTDLSEGRVSQLGIGIHTGTAIVGSMGTPERQDYSLIGAAVNLSARLCGHAKPMSVIVSDPLRQAVGNDKRFRFHSRRHVAIRGLREYVSISRLGWA
jgi:adenylate cyclase